MQIDGKFYQIGFERKRMAEISLGFHPPVTENQLLRDEIIQIIVPSAGRTSFFF